MKANIKLENKRKDGVISLQEGELGKFAWEYAPYLRWLKIIFRIRIQIMLVQLIKKKSVFAPLNKKNIINEVTHEGEGETASAWGPF